MSTGPSSNTQSFEPRTNSLSTGRIDSAPTATTGPKSRHRVAAIVGNPNSGKTTLFNALTGAFQRVGNYPGVTVEKKTGWLRHPDCGEPVELIDLPGSYSLAARDAEEAVVLDVILGRSRGSSRPDLVVVVADATNLSRNLFLAMQILELGRPVVIALNMIDLAAEAGIVIDEHVLESELGVPVVKLVATKRKGLDQLVLAVRRSWDCPPQFEQFLRQEEIRGELSRLAACVGAKSNGFSPNDLVLPCELFHALVEPGGYRERQLVHACGEVISSCLQRSRSRLATQGFSLTEFEARERYRRIGDIVRRAVRHERQKRPTLTDRADRVLTHPAWGTIVFAALMALCFQAIYSWAGPLMDAVEGVFSLVGQGAQALIPPGALRSLVVNGAVAGVGSVLVFLPQIMLLFLFIAILEDCGYMARAAFLMDRWMSRVGLNGHAFIPLMSSFACAIPGILATRLIGNRRDRFITILIAPLMSCSARLPVYTLLIAAFIPAKSLAGGLIGLQALTLLGMYLLGVFVAIGVALVAGKTILRGTPQAFLMELPTYKWPAARTVLYRMYEQGREFCITAGTIIFAVSIVVWALGYFPHPPAIAQKYDALRKQAIAQFAAPEGEHTATNDSFHAATKLTRTDAQPLAAGDAQDSLIDAPNKSASPNPSEPRALARADTQNPSFGTHSKAQAPVSFEFLPGQEPLASHLNRLDQEEAGAYLRQSFLGRMGMFLEPVVRPLGWDWRIGMAVLASFPAREVVVATLGTIYNLGDSQDESSVQLRDKLKAASWPDGRPVFNTAVALSLMVFFALCCQCISTLAVIRRETRSWCWPAFVFAYMTSIAYAAAWITYQVGTRILG